VSGLPFAGMPTKEWARGWIVYDAP